MTRYEATIDKTWEKTGMANVVVTRRQDDGCSDVGVFLVDTFCLGLKEAHFLPELSADELREQIIDRMPADLRESIHPACAKKLIEDAIDYAHTLGFAPHRDFRKARRVLSGIDAALCPREFTFGCDGRPCFIPGPDDSEQRIDRVLAILEAKCGADGFDFEDPDEEIDPRAVLMDWLDDEPENVPRFFEVSGLVTAMQLCPTVLFPTKLIEVLWGPDGPGWTNDEEMKDFLGLLMQYWNEIADRLADALAPGAADNFPIIDICEEDFADDEESDGVTMTAIMMDWSRGFLRCTELWPEAWGDALNRSDLAPHWEVVRWWRDFLKKENRDQIVAHSATKHPRTINLSVKAIARALRNHP